MTLMKALPEKQSADSLVVTQAFCRLMLQISLLAIPVYLGLLMIAIPFDVDAGKLKGVALSIPAVIFLFAAIAYAVGFLTTLPDAQPDAFDGFVHSRRRIYRRKMKMVMIGSGIFALGVTVGTLVLIKAHL
ncbi:hypothetical protein [Leptolyngbya iicbica]|uniref:Uncharacterized protein n=2 Tax=Cyanophyceae TaxID=3028117 RepID=A0A4Q7E2Z7_9CYAN|nr:hypothetical protein [Leptolyngbya sp. LK]RZM75602.1 hypothetical protein DYY88_20065 [Leptolyngbya sp. LK]